MQAMHLPDLIRDLAIIMGLAALTSIIFRRINQPVVLGYILAGILAGPHVPGLPTVTDIPNIKILAELGVIFLMLSLGLEFSFKKIVQSGFSSLVIALVEVLAMGIVGYGLGRWFGWSSMDSIFLGGVLAISSTTIILKAAEELRIEQQPFVQKAFAVLIMEDLVAVVLLLTLSTIAVSQMVSGTELALSLGKLALILPIWILLGTAAIPRALKLARRWMNDESLLIFSLGLCLGLVLLGSALGYSAALGAFITGAILAESREAKKIEHLIEPVKNLFAAVFFVSVGMLFNPEILLSHPLWVLATTIVTISGKFVATACGGIISGTPVKKSVQIGMSLAQIGEFSFIIATLGMSLGVTTEVLYQLAVIVALITSFTTPYLIKASESAGTTIENALPKFLKSRFDDYQQLLIKIASVFNDPRLGGTVTRIKSVLNVAIKGDDSRFNRLSPWGVSLKSISISEHSPAAGRSIRELALRSNTGATIVVIERGGKATTSPKADMRLFPGDELLVLGTDSQLMALGNIVDTPREQATHADDTSDFSLGSALVESRSLLVHKSIRELGLREQFNSLVVGIERNGSRIVNPESDQIIEADDVLWVVGPASALENIRKIAKMGDHNAPPTTAQRAENLPQTMA